MGKEMGIYKITNTINNKIYIGSAEDLYKRKHKHLYDLRHNIHHSKDHGINMVKKILNLILLNI